MYTSATADLGILEGRLTAARAAALDELLAANIPTDLSGITAGMVTALADLVIINAILTPEIADILGDTTALEARLTAARAGYLDNIDADLKELFFEHFRSDVDDLSGVTAGGTVNNPTNGIDNDITSNMTFAVVNQYLELNFGAPTYIKRCRYYGDSGSHPNNRYRWQAYVDDVWVDALIDITDIDLDQWDSWRNFTTPRTSILWRMECTTHSGIGSLIGEIELDGVRIGA